MKPPAALFALLLILLPVVSGAEEEFWRKPEERPAEAQPRHRAAPLRAPSYVYAGPVGYFNFSNKGNNENTAGLRINSSVREFSDVFALRFDAMLGLGGPAEGLAEVDFTLMRGLLVGLGASHTTRVGTSARAGLYVEDHQNSARRGGIFLIKNGGGVELSWPIEFQWSFFGEFGSERDAGVSYNRVQAGLFFKF